MWNGPRKKTRERWGILQSASLRDAHRPGLEPGTGRSRHVVNACGEYHFAHGPLRRLHGFTAEVRQQAPGGTILEIPRDVQRAALDPVTSAVSQLGKIRCEPLSSQGEQLPDE